MIRMKLPDSFTSFRDLNRFHKYADELFIEHQMSLMHRDYAGACDKLLLLKELYLIHMQDEEKLLLPLYKKLISPLPQGGAIEFFVREHKQIIRYLGQFEEEVRSWQQNGPQNELSLVKLFDISFNKQKRM